MDWLSFAGSIIGGLIGGLFTYFGVKLTLTHEIEKEIREECKKAEETKPRLEIIKYTGIKKSQEYDKREIGCSALFLMINDYKCSESRIEFFYDEQALDLNNMVYVEYILKNIGQTEIIDICLSTNLPRNTSLLELDERKFYIKEKLLNYNVVSNKRYIKPGDHIKIRIYYIKDKIIGSIIGSAAITVWLRDVNGRYWSQSLFCPDNKIELPYLSNYKYFKECINIDTALKCFRNPYLW